jgi:O-methyltransferase involved in polyketide biosynthesis
VSERPHEIDPTVPHSARVWNHLLGGEDNYPPDREAGDLVLRMFPDFARLARVQRAFLSRAVRFLAAERGVRQFLDVGSGLPTVDNTHEVAQRVAPESRVVYVDHDPIVLLHAGALLTSTPEGRTDYVEADVRDPGTILARAASTLDFHRPVALMMLGIAGQLSDSEDPWAIVRTLLDALPSGSHLVLSDGTDTNESLNAAVAAYNASSAHTYHLRGAAEIARFFTGLDLVEPGVVETSRWRPDPADDDRGADAVCGVGRKP